MKKSVKILYLILLILILITVSSFLVISYMYRGVFPYNTYINNKYCTGLDIPACNELLCKDAGIGDTVNIRIGDDKYSIAADSISLTVDYSEKLGLILNSQSNILWVERFITGPAMYEIEPDISFDEAKLELEFEKELESIEYILKAVDSSKGGRDILNAINDRLLDPLAMFLFENKDDLRSLRGSKIITKVTKEGFSFEFSE